MRTLYVCQFQEDRSIKSSEQRQKLSRELLVAGAIQFADKEGLDALSMRTLATELGFGVMSLYNHIKDKEDLLEAMAESVALNIEIPKGDRSWKADLSRCTTSAYLLMLKHPWLPGLWGRTLGYAKNRYHNALLRLMRNAGFPEELACRGFHALTMHVVGFSLQVLEMPFKNKKELRQFGKQHLKDLEEQDLPFLREHVLFHMDGKDSRSDFKYMLNLILDGLERDLAEP